MNYSLIEVGDATWSSQGCGLGFIIWHQYWGKLGELRSAKEELERSGIPISGMSDHTVSQSLYLHDPDGNEVELYIDVPEVNWEENPMLALSPIKPLAL